MEIKTDNWLKTHGFTGIEMPITTDGKSTDVILYIDEKLQDEFCVFVQPKEIDRLGNVLFQFMGENAPKGSSYEVFIAERDKMILDGRYRKTGHN